MVDQECGPTRDPTQPALIGMGRLTETVSARMPLTTRETCHTYRPNVYIIDVPRDDNVAPERWNA